MRNDGGTGVEIIRNYKPEKCIIHWFTGTMQELNDLINLNCYFSINENMIRNNMKADWIKAIPKEKLLIESDGPFTKVNGKKYNPDLLYLEYENIAKFLNEPELISLVYNNFATILK